MNLADIPLAKKYPNKKGIKMLWFLGKCVHFVHLQNKRYTTWATNSAIFEYIWWQWQRVPEQDTKSSHRHGALSWNACCTEFEATFLRFCSSGCVLLWLLNDMPCILYGLSCVQWAVLRSGIRELHLRRRFVRAVLRGASVWNLKGCEKRRM